MYNETPLHTDSSRGSPSTDICASDADLICLLSGELPPDEIATLQRHLRQCSTCQENVRSIRIVFHSCAVALEHERDAQTDRTASHIAFRRQLWARSASWSARREAATVRRWLPMAAACLALLLSVALGLARGTDPETMLARALVQQSRLSRPDRSAAKSLQFVWAPDASAGRRSGPVIHAPSPSLLDGDIAAALDAEGFDRHDLLDIGRVVSWRAAHRERRETVSRSGGLLYLQTTVRHGRLRQVIVVIREDDWYVVGLAWTMAGVGRLQVERPGGDVFLLQPGGTDAGSWEVTP